MSARNPHVRAAYEAGEYTSLDGTLWTRGMDGWFSDGGTVTYEDGTTSKMTVLAYHHDMSELIAKENQ